MRAELLAVGTEILLGEIVDSNSAYIAARLPALGVQLYRISQVGDNRERLARQIQASLADNDLVVLTGGLGPTEDDVTREAIADAMGETPFVDSALERHLRAWFEGRNVVMPERNVKQAWRIPSAQSLSNPRGTAPGWWVEKDGKVIVCLPGPPAEMGPMWEGEVAPRLASRAREVIVTRTLKTVGIGEGRVDEMLAELLSSTNPTVGIYARADGIHVRLGVRATDRAAAWALLEPMEARMRDILGRALWGVDDDTLQDVVMRLLAAQGRTLAVVEDGMGGGYLSALLTSVSVGRQVFRGGEVWPSSAASIELASQRCTLARSRWGATVGVGLSLDPGHMLHVAVGDAAGVDMHSYTFKQNLTALRQRAATTALTFLRRRYGS